MAHAESSILPATDLDFGYIHAFFIFGAIVTYFVDLVLGKFLKITVCMYVCILCTRRSSDQKIELNE